MINLRDSIRRGDVSPDDPLSVDIFRGPIGGYGFRTGWWPVKIGDKPFQMYASIPHCLEIDRQREKLIEKLKRAIELAQNNEQSVHGGRIMYRYDPMVVRA